MTPPGDDVEDREPPDTWWAYQDELNDERNDTARDEREPRRW